AMAALGVPTTRSLAAVATGERVRRERWLPGGVLTRVASSHIRVGTFQFFAARGDGDGVRALADHAIARHYPDAAAAANPYRAFLEAVTFAQADLVACWSLIGFIHGVLNTDNTAVCGETIDYGPCAFMDAYHPATVFSSIDMQGRYAFGNQPRILQWNLTRLAETLLPLLADDEAAAIAAAEDILGRFRGRFEQRYHAGLRAKLGLSTTQEADIALARDLLMGMAEGQADFTLTFRRLADAAADPARMDAVRALFADPTRFDLWAPRWLERLDAEGGDRIARAAAMRAVNPIYIPRNHLVEAVIEAAVDRDDFAPFHRLVETLADPFTERDGLDAFARGPEPHERVLQTFCGT
ncbi:hypothetical protein C2U72_28165, partial [Prosthecomicrobium hirschii]|uniref:protein adenylyltransferase SelO family protein n=1 Tax=Prosthecodimorpha hirschii TaxID=665126 RepID=UPI00112C6F93